VGHPAEQAARTRPGPPEVWADATTANVKARRRARRPDRTQSFSRTAVH
jgi:hypothetical protein